MSDNKKQPKSFSFDPEGGKKTALYNGEVELEFDDSNYQHKYLANGVEVPSVTTILGSISKPDLTTWAAKMGAERFLELVTPGDIMDEVRIENTASAIQWAHRNFLKTAGTIGTVAHSFAESYILWRLKRGKKPKPPFNAPAKRASEAFLRWVKDNEIEFHESEFQVYSREHIYAGTVDIDATVAGERCIVDLKTAKGIYKEHIFQVAAYIAAIEEEKPDVKYDAAWIVKIDKSTAKCTSKRIPRDVIEVCAESFLSIAKAVQGIQSTEKWLRRKAA